MGYLSFHAGTEGKIKRTEIKKATGHTFRKSEQRYKTHSNQDINRDKTHLNIEGVWNGRPLEETVEERLANEFAGKRALRKDAVVVREVIAQPSADYFEGLTDEEKQNKLALFIEDSYEWFTDEFGKPNVLGFSGHLDETNPHVHFAIMPMTDDGRISQKDFFKGPADLKRMHREFREHMNTKGWDFSLENKNENAKGVDLDTYKSNAQTIESQRAEISRQTRLMKDDKGIQAIALNELKTEYLPAYKKRLKVDMEKDYAEALEAEKERLAKENEKVLAKERAELVEAQHVVNQRAKELDGREKEVDSQIQRAKKMYNRIKGVVMNARGTDFQKEGILKYLKTGHKEPSAFLVDSNVKSVISTQSIIDEIENDGLER